MADLISRAAAVAQIKENYCDWCDHTDLCPSCETRDCIATIEQQVPAVDAAPVVHGRWVADSDGLPVCSVCDEVAMQRLHCDTLHGAWRYDVRLVKTPYCPNCGAKMGGEADG